MTHAIAAVKDSRITPNILVALCAAFVALYAVSVFSIVENTAVRARAERQINTLSSEVGDLEFSYISLKGSLSADQVAQAGLAPVSALSYVSRDAQSVAFADARASAH